MDSQKKEADLAQHQKLTAILEGMLAGEIDFISGTRDFLSIQNEEGHPDTILFEKFQADLPAVRISKDWKSNHSMPISFRKEVQGLCDLYYEGIIHACNVLLEKHRRRK